MGAPRWTETTPVITGSTAAVKDTPDSLESGGLAVTPTVVRPVNITTTSLTLEPGGTTVLRRPGPTITILPGGERRETRWISLTESIGGQPSSSTRNQDPPSPPLTSSELVT